MKELKIGDNLYELIYSHPFDKTERTLRKFTISKINVKSYSLKGIEWRIPKHKVGVTYFPSKKEMYENTLKLHQVELSDMKESIKIFRKEIRYLNKKIKSLSTRSSKRLQHIVYNGDKIYKKEKLKSQQ